MDTIPVFDFNNPWVALIQLALVYLLPRLTGLVSDRFAASHWKIAMLGGLTVVGSALTWLLDIAIAQTWSTLDWTEFVNVVVNAALTFFLAQGTYRGVIVPLGQAERDAQSTALQFIPADPARLQEAAFIAQHDDIRPIIREEIEAAKPKRAAKK